MSAVSDPELLLFHYRDGLASERIVEIEEALFLDAGLRLRLAALRETLSAIGEAWPEPAPDAGLEQRLWERLESVVSEPRPGRLAILSWRDWINSMRPAPLALALVALAASGLGYLIGQRELVEPSPLPVSYLAEDASARVLHAYLAAHLLDTERALLVASHSPSDAESARDIAQRLLESHRMYAAAADRAGKPALGRFLRELEPVLIELANEQGDVPSALGAEIFERDLAFKARAAASALDHRASFQIRSL